MMCATPTVHGCDPPNVCRVAVPVGAWVWSMHSITQQRLDALRAEWLDALVMTTRLIPHLGSRAACRGYAAGA